MIRIVAVGDVHGRLTELYERVGLVEAVCGPVDTVIQVGDLGVFPNEDRADAATVRHGGVGEFPIWLAEKRRVPWPTVFVKGNHEDFDFLASRQDGLCLDGLFWLRNGSTMTIRTQAGDQSVQVGGLGGCWAPSKYRVPVRGLNGKARAYYVAEEVERLAKSRADILVFHDAPAGIDFDRYTSQAGGLGELVDQVRPRVVLFGHHHQSRTGCRSGVPYFGLNLLGRPGDVAVIEVNGQQISTTLM